jgi:hypothetical protein
MSEKYGQYLMILSANQMLAGDLEVLMEFSKGDKIIVELGTARGLGAMILSTQGGKVYTIDHFKGIERADDKGISFSTETGKKDWITAITGFLSYWNSIEVICSDTVEASKSFKNSYIDLLFIDGDHSYSGVKKDYSAWFDKVKPGGHILFHDCGNGHVGIDKFCNELIENECKNGVLELIDYTTEYRTIIKIFRRTS